ncbi:hypothetical protein F511_10107 [Dorcoceras hygrometricum]|uniref:Uncharacterized protein n=1 Tax=Dorcoceras hygrometricum TaxID=472368 RepID=A0A2Z7AC04_9LAMI|nr:hypothetical protein F511_10107 [Dorcoceras hygrometricum]
MEAAASRRIRGHFNATHHFRAACSTAYNEILSQRATAGVDTNAVHEAVVRVHDVLRVSLRRYGRRVPFNPSRNGVERVIRSRRGQRRPDPGWDGVYRALQLVVRIHGSDLTEEIVLDEEEFEEIALDVIVGDVWWYMRLDAVSRILYAAAVICIAAVGKQDRYVFFAEHFALHCVVLGALYFLAVRFRTFFFLL